LIFDNGSIDESVVIAKSWAARDPRFRFVDASGGPKNGSYCRNLGLAAATGEYVLFLDADDLLSARCLDSRLQYMQQSGERLFYVFPIETFREKPGDDKRVWEPEKEHPLRKLLFHQISWGVMSTLWRCEFLRSIGGFDESYLRFQDIETHIRGILRSSDNFSVAGKATPSAFYRCCDARMHKSSRETLMDYIESGKRFLTQIPLCLGQFGKSGETAYLSGTAMVLLQRVGRGARAGAVSQSEAESLAGEVLGIGKENNLWSPAIASVLAYYLRGGERIAARIKGVNLSFRWILSSLARV
jgi:glycosyltransferase involved in cell wall biosynthesis